ncbi:uncharacterized protein syt18b [Betta splendens]|uniref:Uncharacterized protein syt18b n=1 Tax=Betta splendens TaxID=158456 RepID=A0A6P7MQY9_BETSP|nr:uncharacterized protein syt18b [Betta splendens]
MPHHDDEYPDQPVWQSVLLFCCKGMIEGIMVILFFWLLVQVLFTKHLEVHLQVLLLVGLIVFCLSLMLGCVLCWRKSQICAVENKHPVTSAAAPPEPVTFAQDPPPSATAAKRQQQEEDLVEYPSTFTSPGPSELEFTAQPPGASNRRDRSRISFSLRRLSTPPLTSPLYKPIGAGHASRLALPTLGLFSKTRAALQRRCTIAGDRASCNEHSRLTAVSASMSEEPVPLTPLTYGSGAGCRRAPPPKPCLHLIMGFAPEQQVLTVTVLSVSGTPHTLEDLWVLGSLPPLHPRPTQACARGDPGREAGSLGLALKVSSVEELQRCTLKIAVHAREPNGPGGAALGEAEADCGGRDWLAERCFHVLQELSTNTGAPRKGPVPDDGGRRCPPQILVLLHYQALARRIKAAIIRVANLDELVHASAGADYNVVINLHHDGAVISRRQTKGGSSAVLNTSFLFDVPEGNISQLQLMMEFIVVQDICRDQVLGRVVVGAEAADAGRAHWRDTCSLQGEQVRWHTLQPEPQQSSDSYAGNAV